MVDKDKIFKGFFKSVSDSKKRIAPSLLANLRRAGAFVDVRKLLDAGWTQKNGLQHGCEVLENGSVIIQRRFGDGPDAPVCTAFLSNATDRKPSGQGGHPKLKDEALVAAYVGTGPYFAYLRWLDIPGTLDADSGRALVEIDDATAEPVSLLVDDIEHLLWDSEYRGKKQLNAHDAELAKLFNLATHNFKNHNVKNVCRLYAPLMRALLTDDDPAGRAFLAETEDAELLIHIAVDLAQANMRDGVRAVLGAILLKFWDRVEAEFDSWDWMESGSIASWLKEYMLASYLYARGASMIRDAKDRRSAAFDASRNLMDYLKTLPRQGEELDFMVAKMDDLMGDIGVYDHSRVLQALMHAWRDGDTGDGPSDEARDLLDKAIDKRCDEFDAAMASEDDHLKALPCSVKAQLAWQTLIALIAGRMKDAIDSFPNPVLSDGSKAGIIPPHTFVGGLPVWDVWRGLVDDFGDMDYETLMGRLSERPKHFRPQRKVALRFSDQSDRVLMMHQRFYKPTKGKFKELDILAVEGMPYSKEVPTEITMCFPYLPKERAENAPNCVFGVWEYFPWRRQMAADARIELANGRQIYALMPYYIYDREYSARGQKISGLLAVFPATASKSDSNEDYFRQGMYNECVFMSGVQGCGVVKSAKRLSMGCVNGDIIRFAVDIEGIGADIPVVVNAAHIDGALPAAGDRIAFEGWVYIDGFDSAESNDEYRRKYPDGRIVPPPPKPATDCDDPDKPDQAHDKAGEPSVKKSPDIFLVECKLAGTSHIDDIERKMAGATVGARLALKRDKSNNSDSDAIAVLNPGNVRVGYVPQKQNTILSRLMDGGKTLYATVVSKKSEDGYFNVTIGIYLEEK